MKDLRNMTDAERDRYLTCKIPDWVYFAAAGLAVIVAVWTAAPLVVGVIGIAREVW